MFWAFLILVCSSLAICPCTLLYYLTKFCAKYWCHLLCQNIIYKCFGPFWFFSVLHNSPFNVSEVLRGNMQCPLEHWNCETYSCGHPISRHISLSLSQCSPAHWPSRYFSHWGISMLMWTSYHFRRTNNSVEIPVVSRLGSCHRVVQWYLDFMGWSKMCPLCSPIPHLSMSNNIYSLWLLASIKL